ncbi:phage tail protein, partial [Vibrio parahaemolyticus]
MAISNYRGFNLQSGGPDGSIWKVKIKNHVLQGSLTAVKKSIDWWCDTASI